MSGKLGTCINCGKTEEGIYTMDVYRGWVDDKYNLHIEICEECIGKIINNFNNYLLGK